MADSFALGSIPPLSLWEGETLTFTVTNPNSPAGKFSIRATPAPKGTLSLDEDSGAFSYQAAREDREEFSVMVRHGEKAQTFSITPQPRLASDFHVIDHISDPPARDSGLYITYSEEDAGRAVFNNQIDYKKESEAEIDTKRVTVAGVKLVFERSEDPSSLYKRLNGRTDLRELTLCADEIVIGAEMKLPGTEVSICARVLTFTNAGQINTTPLSVQTRPPRDANGRDEALRGQKGGDVHLIFEEIHCPPNPMLAITNGGKGQPAREGIEGERGKSYKQWDGKYLAKAGVAGEKTFDWSAEIKKKTGDYVPVTAEIWRINQLAKPSKVTCVINGALKDDGDAMKEVPTSGSPPKLNPGFPGHGGDGGNVVCSQIAKWAACFQMNTGTAGEMAQNVKAAPAGTPSKWSVIKATYNPQFFDPDMELGEVIQMFHNRGFETQDGPPGIAPGPNPNSPAARRGLPRGVEFSWEWIHPLTVRAFISYARDLMLSGHTENLRSLLVLYRDSLAQAIKFAGFRYKGDHVNPQDQMLAATLADEVSNLISVLDGPYDYFGNPAGWVPMLSFQANMQLFENEVDVALRVMFLAHWVESKENRERKAAATLTKTANHLREESTKALADYQVAYNKLDDLETRVNKVKQDLEDCAQELKTTESNLRSKVKGDLQLEHVLRSSGKVLGGVMQLIPAGQPVLGAFGKSLTALSDIDLDDPKASASKIASPLAIVAGTKFKEKASKLYDEMKSTKDKEEKEDKDKEFNEKVAAADLKERVETHRKEQKAAKESIIDALSGFTVSEDDIEERLEKILADTPGYQEVVEEVKRLNTRKAALAEELLSVLDAIDQATTTILKNQFALIKVRAQLDTKLEAINPQLRQYVQGMGQRARDRLLHYQYYMVKSYQYLMLEDLPVIDYRSQALIKAFVPMLTASPDGTLTADQFNQLKAVFDDQLRQTGKRIIDYYQDHTARNTAILPVTLTKDQVETLNAQGQVDIDLLPWLNPQREDLRITGIETYSVTLAEPLPTGIVAFSLEYRHDGVSRIRRGGKLYLFRTGQYRIAAGKGEATADQYRNDKVFWASDITYDPKAGSDNNKVKITETKVSKEEKSLVRQLIKGNVKDNEKEKDPLLSFQPAAWTRLRVTRSGNYGGKISDLTLQLNLLFHKVDDRLSTVLVRVEDEIAPFIRCEPLDVNKTGDGYGPFLRTFDTQTSGKVKLRAPQRYGQRAFVGWRVGASGQNAEASLIKEPLVTLDMKKRDYLLEPVYEADEFVPVVENVKWPPCPTGWNWLDWEFKNGVNVPITINRLDWTPWFELVDQRGYVPAVNEPQGTEQVKLSLDRLQLMPNETARISVCTNPASPASGPHIMFNWIYKSFYYAVIFNADASFAFFRKWEHERWHQEESQYSLDKTNRLVTFRG